jgi:hypothetical protein
MTTFTVSRQAAVAQTVSPVALGAGLVSAHANIAPRSRLRGFSDASSAAELALEGRR